MRKVPESPNHKKDIEYSLKVTHVELNLIGLWPSVDEDSILKKLSTKLLQVFCQFLLYFVLIPGILKMFLRDLTPQAMLKLFGPMCNCLITIIKYTILAGRGKDIQHCVEHMQSDWRNVRLSNDRKIMMEYARIGRNLAVISTIFVYTSGYLYRAIVPLTKGTVVVQNVTIRPMPLPGFYMFFNAQISPAYEIVFALQFMTGFVQYFVTSGAVSLAATLVLHACGQLKLLMTRMEDLTEGENHPRKGKNLQLGFVVQRHMRIQSFLSLVQNTLQHICLVEVIGCTVILCLLAYYIILEWKGSNSIALFTYSILLASFTFNIFILCFIGELLHDQGIKVHLTACTLNWYRLPEKTVKSLILVVAMSSTPINITAGKFMNLSLHSFGTIVKTSIAYLNMLRATSI